MATFIPDGLQIGQDLAGVAEVGETVDDRNGGILGQGVHFLLGIGADHDAVAEAGQDPGSVLHRLVAADLAVLAGQEDGVAAQLIDTSLEGDTGTGGILFKDHGQGLARQERMGDALLFHIFQLVSHVQDLNDLFGGQVQQFQQVFLHGKFLLVTIINSRRSCGDFDCVQTDVQVTC